MAVAFRDGWPMLAEKQIPYGNNRKKSKGKS
jgi:hypothetical protein